MDTASKCSVPVLYYHDYINSPEVAIQLPRFCNFNYYHTVYIVLLVSFY